MSERDGGPAFAHPATHIKPDNDRDYVIPAQRGMTLRQWYAGMTLVGLLLSDEMARAAVNPGGRYTTADEFAKAAHDLADAMLAHEQAERERETG